MYSTVEKGIRKYENLYLAWKPNTYVLLQNPFAVHSRDFLQAYGGCHAKEN